jgi:hypothetical protein
MFIQIEGSDEACPNSFIAHDLDELVVLDPAEEVVPVQHHLRVSACIGRSSRFQCAQRVRRLGSVRHKGRGCGGIVFVIAVRIHVNVVVGAPTGSLTIAS